MRQTLQPLTLTISTVQLVDVL